MLFVAVLVFVELSIDVLGEAAVRGVETAVAPATARPERRRSGAIAPARVLIWSNALHRDCV
jgi:hypothetical protein